MPAQVCGIVHDKSSWARRGLAVQNTVIEPGWRGFLTLELTNHGDEVLEIEAGSPIAQILFHWIDHPPENLYSGKYQDQRPGPVPYIHEEQ
jgi:dCTP deaminase